MNKKDIRIRHEDFVEGIAVVKRVKSYLELGVYHGECFNQVAKYIGKKENVIGVDSMQEPLLDGTLLKMTTDEFFLNNTKTFDMIFIDADHTYESVKKDFYNSVKVLNPGGIIILHDTDPFDDSLINPLYCGDGYKIVEDLEKSDLYNIITLPLENEGISIVMRKNETRVKLRQ